MEYKYSEHYNGIIEDLKGLLQIESVMGESLDGAPFGRETLKALDYTLKLGKRYGFKTKNVDGYAGHIEWGEGEELFGALCHLDVVPPGEGWSYPPFSATEKDGKIYARGAIDDKSPAVAVLYAAKRLKEEGFVPSKKFRLILGLNEESGWKCIDYYLKKECWPDIGFSPDADFPLINREKGAMFLTLSFNLLDGKISALGGGNRVNMVPDYAYFIYDGAKKEFGGKSAHGSTPHKGDNAIIKMFNKLSALTDDNCVKNICKYFCGGLGELELNLKDDESGNLTMNLGTAELSGNTVKLGIDIRFPITKKREEIENILKDKLNGICEIEVNLYHKPLYVPESDSLVVKLLAAYNKVTGENGKCIAIGGATYARALDRCVAFGPMFPGQEPLMHCADENIEIEKLYLMTEIYYQALKSLL